MKKTTDQAYEILEDAATNTNQWPRERVTPVNTVGGTDNAVLNNLVNHVAQLTKQLIYSREQQMPYRPIRGNCVNFVEDSIVAWNASQETLQWSKPSMCPGLVRINHSSKDRMGETATKIRIRGKGGVTVKTRIIRTIKGMGGVITRTICHQIELMNHPLRKIGFRASSCTDVDFSFRLHE